MSLLCNLSSNLTDVKTVPQLLPTDEIESETDDFDWYEYLTKDLPQKSNDFTYDSELSSSVSRHFLICNINDYTIKRL